MLVLLNLNLRLIVKAYGKVSLVARLERARHQNVDTCLKLFAFCNTGGKICGPLAVECFESGSWKTGNRNFVRLNRVLALVNPEQLSANGDFEELRVSSLDWRFLRRHRNSEHDFLVMRDLNLPGRIETKTRKVAAATCSLLNPKRWQLLLLKSIMLLGNQFNNDGLVAFDFHQTA